MIKAVLFDLGGTLHTAEKPKGRDVWFAERLIGRLSDYGIQIDDTPQGLAEYLNASAEAYKHASELSRRELPADEIWADYYLKKYNISKEAIGICAEELSFLYDYERVKIMRRPHLQEMFHELKEMGLRTGMISNIISRSVVPHFLAEYGILDQMDCIVTSSETGIRKPDPGIFRVAEERLGLRPDELAYVGDTISRDIMGTRNAGWKLMIQISNPSIAFRDAGLEDSGFKADKVVTDLMEIPPILREMMDQ